MNDDDLSPIAQQWFEQCEHLSAQLAEWRERAERAEQDQKRAERLLREAYELECLRISVRLRVDGHEKVVVQFAQRHNVWLDEVTKALTAADEIANAASAQEAA